MPPNESPSAQSMSVLTTSFASQSEQLVQTLMELERQAIQQAVECGHSMDGALLHTVHQAVKRLRDILIAMSPACKKEAEGAARLDAPDAWVLSGFGMAIPHFIVPPMTRALAAWDGIICDFGRLHQLEAAQLLDLPSRCLAASFGTQCAVASVRHFVELYLASTHPHRHYVPTSPPPTPMSAATGGAAPTVTGTTGTRCDPGACRP